MAADHVFSFTTGNICTDPSHSISEVQGSDSSSPVSGQQVSVRGIVTADFTSGGASGIPANQGMRGFFLEAATSDRDADGSTSEGIFVFDGDGSFAGGVGDVVAVRGGVSEFNGVTQIIELQTLACALDLELPAAAPLDLPMPLDEREAAYEPLEAMRVTHPELTVTEFFQLERFGELRLSASGVLQTPTNIFEPGTQDAIDLAAANTAATIILDDGRTGQNLNLLNSGDDYLPYVRAGETLRIGDQLIDHPAILHFGFGVWRLQPIDIDDITDELAANRTRPRQEAPPTVGGNLKVASFNVLNYFNGDGQGGGFPTTRGAVTLEEFQRQTEKLVDAITRLNADVYGLIEIENDGGEWQAARTLVDALNAEVGPDTYRFVDTGVIGTDEIKQAFIYDRRTVRPVGDWAILTSAVDPRFNDDLNRPALAQSFVRLGSGERVTVVVNHLKSKSQSDLEDETDPNFDQGDGQGFWNLARTQAAEALADWVASNPTGENVVGTLIIGDLNSYGREDPIRALEDAGFEDQLVEHTDGIPYTFTFDGMQGTLDTALATDALASRVTGAAVWHINADEVPAIDYQLGFENSVPFNQRFRTPEIAEAYYDPSAFRSSDHDPVLIGLNLGRPSAQIKK
jgi:predicted extracellular nuclease